MSAASFTMGWIVGPFGRFGATVPNVSTGGTFLVEWLLSFVLMLVILAAATNERVAPGFAGIAVGLTVGFCAMACPAVLLGPRELGIRRRGVGAACRRSAHPATGH